MTAALLRVSLRTRDKRVWVTRRKRLNPGPRDYRADTRLPGLCSKCQSHLLRQQAGVQIGVDPA